MPATAPPGALLDRLTHRVHIIEANAQAPLAGYEDTDDVGRLSVDPTARHVVGGRRTASHLRNSGSGFVVEKPSRNAATCKRP